MKLGIQIEYNERSGGYSYFDRTIYFCATVFIFNSQYYFRIVIPLPYQRGSWMNPHQHLMIMMDVCLLEGILQQYPDQSPPDQRGSWIIHQHLMINVDLLQQCPNQSPLHQRGLWMILHQHRIIWNQPKQASLMQKLFQIQNLL